MILRKLLMATAILASAVTTACSDMMAPGEMQPPELTGRASLAEGSRTCPAPGTGLAGAWNMTRDETMFTIPMVRNVQGNGNAGMVHAVAVSAC
jgi:hypothetical protein